jgi:transposase
VFFVVHQIVEARWCPLLVGKDPKISFETQKWKRTTRNLLINKGYNSQAFRTYLLKKGILTRIPLKKNQKLKRGRKPTDFQIAYKQRFKVERCFAWMNIFRRLVIPYDRSFLMYQGFCILACILMCLRYF